MINISLKIFLILSFILNLSGCQNSTLALITNQGDDTVSIVNLDDLEVIKTLQTDKGPLGVEFIDTNHAVISNTKNQTLQVINLNNFEITNRIKLGFTPLGMVSITKEKRLYVSSWYENKIYLFDTQSWKQLLQIEVAKTPSGLAYNTKQGLLICANRDENIATIIKDNKILKTIKTGEHPFGVYTRDDQAFTVNVYSNNITQIDLNNFSSKEINSGSHPYNMVIHKNKIFITNTQDDTVSVVNKTTQELIVNLKTQEVPENIGIDETNNQLVITNWGSNTISIFDLNTLKLIKHIKTGKESRAFGNFIWSKR